MININYTYLVIWCCILAMFIQETKPLLKKGCGVLFEWKGKSQPILDGLCKTTLNAQHVVGKPSLAVCLSVRNHLDFEGCCLLGFYAASSGNSLTMFQDDLSVLSSRLMKYS